MPSSRLRQEADAIRAARVFGRALTLHRLFDILVAEAEAGRVPTELDLAIKAFGKPDNFDVASDSSVRVNIHRLRQKLAEHYEARPTASGVVLIIPKGTYQLQLVQTPDTNRAPKPGLQSTPRRHLLWGLGGVAAGTVLGAAAAYNWMDQARVSSRIKAFGLWKSLDSSRPIILALNDFYIFGDSQNSLSVQRLIRQFDINSSTDLETYRAAGGPDSAQFVDLNMSYVPIDVALLQQNLPLDNVKALPVSEVTPETLRQSHVIYLGYFSGLGLLREPIFKRSRLQPGETFDELIDRESGEVYRSQIAGSPHSSGVQLDYGYVANLKSPSGGRLIIIAGTRDPGLAHVSRLLCTPAALSALEQALGRADEYEALYRVEGMGRVDMKGELVFARSI